MGLSCEEEQMERQERFLVFFCQGRLRGTTDNPSSFGVEVHGEIGECDRRIDGAVFYHTSRRGGEVAISSSPAECRRGPAALRISSVALSCHYQSRTFFSFSFKLPQ